MVDRANEADAITREVILAVRRTVITPFGAIVTGFGIARRWASSEKVARVTPKQG